MKNQQITLEAIEITKRLITENLTQIEYFAFCEIEKKLLAARKDLLKNGKRK